MSVKKMLLASVAIGAMTVSAFASDLPSKTSAPAALLAAKPYDWNGFYVGLNAGLVANNSAIDNQVNKDSFYCGYPCYDGGLMSMRDDAFAIGGIGGVQAGFNWSDGNVLLGVEADYGMSSASKTNDYHNQSDDEFGSISTKLNSFATARLRAGLVHGNALFYVTGGLAAGEVKTFAEDLYLVDGGENTTLVDDKKWMLGYTVGAGSEVAISSNATLKIEALYYDLGSTTWDTSASYGEEPGYASLKNDVSGVVARVGLNYKF